nr:protein root hair defective 3 [Tanacetum cinerariifolium]
MYVCINCEYYESMQDDLHQFQRLNVLELVPRPTDINIIEVKWIWKNKTNAENTVIILLLKGKSRKASLSPKLVPSTESNLELLHMDLCRPMRVANDKKGKRIAKEGDKKEKMNASTIKTILKQMSVEDPVSNKLFKELMIYFLIEEVLLCGPNAKIVRKATCRLRDFDGCNTVNWAQAIKDHMDYSFERAKEWVEAGRVGQHSFSGAAPVLEAILFERIPDVRPDIFSAGILPIEMYEAQRTNLSNSFENLASIQACLYCPSAENTPSLQNTPSLENSHAAAAATNLENSPAAAATNLENSLLAEQFSELSVSLVGDAAGSSEAAIQTDLSLSSRNVASTTEDLDKDEDVGGDADVFEDQKYTDVGADAYVGQVQEFANVGADSAVAVKAGTVRADAYVCEIQEDSDVSADEAVPIKSRTVDVTVGDAAVGEAQPAQPLRRSTRQSRRTKRYTPSDHEKKPKLPKCTSGE